MGMLQFKLDRKFAEQFHRVLSCSYNKDPLFQNISASSIRDKDISTAV
jgi:hypothetical protein